VLQQNTITLEHIYEPVQSYLAKVEDRILDLLSTDNELSSEVIRYFFKSKGKLLRPALTLLGASFGMNDLAPVVSVAAAFEIFHSATLIHDDIIDCAYLRRNYPTVNTKWNSQIAVMIGDFLHDRAIKAFFNSKNERLMASALNMAGTVCDGEILEMKERHNFNLTEQGYFTIIERKTAMLLATCLESGAILAGFPDERVFALKRYGMNFGKAFQIMDDCLDIIGNEHEFGKTLGADLEAGTLTLPVIRLVSLLDEKEKARIYSKVKSGFAQPELGDFIRLLEAHGVIEYSIGKAKEFTEYANLELSIFPDSPARQSLEELLGYVIQRKR